MTFALTKAFSLEAAHFLPRAPQGHKCRRMHGHSFGVVVHVHADELTDAGWVLDFAEITAAFAAVHDRLDHRLLNDVPGLENPTSEVLAQWIFDQLAETLPGLSAVEVRETCTSACRYSRS